jgi:hypothetical protein
MRAGTTAIYGRAQGNGNRPVGTRAIVGRSPLGVTRDRMVLVKQHAREIRPAVPVEVGEDLIVMLAGAAGLDHMAARAPCRIAAGPGFSHHQTRLPKASSPMTMSRSPSPSMSCTAPPASIGKRPGSMTLRCQPEVARRYQTREGAVARRRSGSPGRRRRRRAPQVAAGAGQMRPGGIDGWLGGRGHADEHGRESERRSSRAADDPQTSHQGDHSPNICAQRRPQPLGIRPSRPGRGAAALDWRIAGPLA